MVRLSPGLSYISDPERGDGIILAENTGQYFAVSIEVLELLFSVVASRKGDASRELAAYCDNEATRDCILELLNARVLLPANSRGAEIVDRHRIRQRRRSAGKRAKSFLSWISARHPVERRQPKLWMALFLAVANLWYRLRLCLEGWRPVSTARQKLSQGGEFEVVPVDLQYNVIDELMAAMRLSCLAPWVRRDCVPSSLALHSLLNYLGLSSDLVVGAKVFPFEPHMWVELWGKRVDSGVDEQSLDRFEPISQAAKEAV